MAPKKGEREWLTRKARIDPRLDDAGWTKPRGGASPLRGAYRTEEHETANGPADYALWLDRELIGILEAKRVTTNPQEVLGQAERYARGLQGGRHNYGGLRVPFLYSSNGELIWFRDVRSPANLRDRCQA